MKEVARFGGDLSNFAPPEIIKTLRMKLQQVNEKN
jgi:pantetheine-phosphate adenylyltransferase